MINIAKKCYVSNISEQKKYILISTYYGKHGHGVLGQGSFFPLKTSKISGFTSCWCIQW